MSPARRILIVEDDPILLEQLTWALKEKFEVLAASDAREGRNLCESAPDVYLFDMRLPPSGEVEEGLNLLKEVRRREPDATVVMMSGEGERRDALQAMSLGAFDFFQKPVDPAELRVILARALERRRLIDENRELRERAREDATFGKLLGKSAVMRRLFREIEKVAPSDVTVGPDGAIYVADWHDKRTAHPDPDAEWDRSNGRIYRIQAKRASGRRVDVPDFRIGDQVNGGNVVVDIVASSELEISAQVAETDRGNLKEGQQVMVKVINIDPTGKIRLSRKALLQDEPGTTAEPAPAAKE